MVLINLSMLMASSCLLMGRFFPSFFSDIFFYQIKALQVFTSLLERIV